MKAIFLFIFSVVCLLSGCTSYAPEPKQAKGDWYELNTTMESVKEWTYP